MSLTADPSVYTDLTGLARLRSQARASNGRDPETLRAVAGQFEALFINMMLKSMRQASPGDGLMDNDQTRFYQGMFDQQIGLEMTKGKGLGLAEMLVRQLGGEQAAPPQSPQPAPGRDLPAVVSPFRLQHGTSPPAATAPPAQAGEAAGSDWPPPTPDAFVRQLWPHAREAAGRLGVDPALLLAQSALETGWGQKMPRHADGRPSFNLFGIKAGPDWSGPRVLTQTLENRGGLVQREQAAFRAYDSPAASLEDYAAFIRGRPRYRQALQQAGDPAAYVQALGEAGYATDPEYASKIMNIYTSPAFRSAVDALKGNALLAASR
ncbi:flagellar assembly peptidoglycan hydrolase FlgJ [Thiohalobacter sp. IOR34]|uniref:flagellar assembly peptidoglycan hydrolase FlgJ n=1 Tax=Thiohalobacter sp. IOR34 TaxID=3057176 RepID=UPI0025AF80EB|nr:flagellar assembly peptidoglycan hydrolase FlgJ [Thiohalobacter sp. IOR34]WJW74607.1 flagellar assembly peptidoglycan hydrolase FlgJ [Thiohalobacter sp. IOR34]